MTAFRGRHSVRLDPKGRFILPALFRQAQKSNQFFMTNNIYGGQAYLDVYSEKEWLNFEKKIAGMPSLNQDVQAFRRFYLASAVPVGADAQGRMLVPQELRDYAGLGDDIVLLGVGGKFEIWDAKKWAKFQTDVSKSYEQILASVSSFEGGA
jgi:MraZ protein